MIKPARLLLPSLLFALFLLPSVSRADPLALTGGSLSLPGSGLPNSAFSFSFQGQGVTLQGTGSAATSPSPRDQCLTGCGSTVNLGSTFADLGTGTAIINGTTYNVQFSGTLNFVSSNVTIPPGSTSPLTFTQPFTLSGSLSGSPTGGGATIFSYTLNGQGLATLTLVFNQTTGNYQFGSLTYNVTATPEPATLILLSTGLAGTVAGFRRRRRACASDGGEV